MITDEEVSELILMVDVHTSYSLRKIAAESHSAVLVYKCRAVDSLKTIKARFLVDRRRIARGSQKNRKNDF